MSSLTDLNAYVESLNVEVTDDRPADTIFDGYTFSDIQLDFATDGTVSSGTITTPVDTPQEITEVINYQTSLPVLTLTLTSTVTASLLFAVGSDPRIVQVGNVYTISDITCVADWDELTEYSLVVDDAITDDDSVEIAANITYYCANICSTVTFKWYSFDPLYYYDAAMHVTSLMVPAPTRIVTTECNMDVEATFISHTRDLDMVVTASVTCDARIVQLGSADMVATSTAVVTPSAIYAFAGNMAAQASIEATPFAVLEFNVSLATTNDTDVRLDMSNDANDYTVDWGDGNTITYYDGDYCQHIYSSIADYTIKISHNPVDTSDVAFEGMYNLNQRPIITKVKAWEASTGVKTDQTAIQKCINLAEVPEWIPSTWTSLTYSFWENTVFNQDISMWDVSNITDMSYMFGYASTFNQPLNNWDVSNVTNMARMFRRTTFNQDISSWDVSSVTNMSWMFMENSYFNQPLNDWDVSSVTNMDGMFNNNLIPDSVFNQPLNNWDVSNVTIMLSMFGGAKAFNQPLNNWDVSNVTDMGFLFGGTPFNQDISMWDVNSVTNMDGMFYRSAAFNKDINLWDVSSVTSMEYMFGITTVFNQPLNEWDVSSVTTMSGMFLQAAAFNKDISEWDTSNVTDMSEMFDTAAAFDQDISSWDVALVTDHTVFDRDTLPSWTAPEKPSDWGGVWSPVLFTSDMVAVATVVVSSTKTKFECDMDVITTLTASNVVTATAEATMGVISTLTASNVVTATAEATMDVVTTVYAEPVAPLPDAPFTMIIDTSLDATKTLEINTTTDGVIDWGDGNDEAVTGDVITSHTYTTDDTFTVTVSYTGGTIRISSGGAMVTEVTTFGNVAGGGLTSLDGTFKYADNLVSVPDTLPSTVTVTKSMFYGDDNINDSNISLWDVSNVTDMNSMFGNTGSFNQPLNDWDVSSVDDMERMFNRADVFNQPLNNWDTSSVTEMDSMFRDADVFDQDISGWCVTNISSEPRDFDSGTLATWIAAEKPVWGTCP